MDKKSPHMGKKFLPLPTRPAPPMPAVKPPKSDQLAAMENHLQGCVDVLQLVIDWNLKYPSHRIYSQSEIVRIAAQMDEINERAQKAVSKIREFQRTTIKAGAHK